ncbi:MAG: ester cyclase [Mycobacteriales bacterium]
MVTRASALDTFSVWHVAHEQRDLDGLRGVLDDDVEVHSLFRPAPVRGRDLAVDHFSHTMRTFADLAMPVVAGPAAADSGVVFAEVEFAGTFTGMLQWAGTAHIGQAQAFRVDGAVVLHTDGGRVCSVRTLFDRDAWLRQIGVLPGSA